MPLGEAAMARPRQHEKGAPWAAVSRGAAGGRLPAGRGRATAGNRPRAAVSGRKWSCELTLKGTVVAGSCEWRKCWAS